MMVNRFNFRVWDKENERMVYPNGNGYFNLKNDTVIDGNGKLFDLVCQETVDNCILMQSTGLVDKNGKEVFEGDIIKIYKLWMNFIPYPVKAQVFWSITENHFCLRNVRELFRVGFGGWSNIKNYEVIGNIYENPNFEFDDNL